MANAAKLQSTMPVRALILGYPKAGKTGALASLLNAGFKIRMIDFDGNYEPLLTYSRPDALHRLDILHFEDKMRIGPNFQEPVGMPEAFAKALKAMDSWKYTDDGVEVDLGSSKDWGPDTIVVLDSLTAMGDASMKRAQKLMNKTPLNVTQKVWGLAQQEQLEFIKKLTSTSNRFHVVVLSHLKMIGPKDVEADDSALTADLKKQVANLVDTRLFPSALGRSLPQTVGGEFPMIILAETRYKGSTVQRVLSTYPRPDVDLGVPHPSIPAELPLADGMLTIFKTLSPGSVAMVGETT